MVLLLTGVVATTVTGCGGQKAAGEPTSSDAQVAAAIRASAKQRELERDRRAKAVEARRRARTTTIQAQDVLPAGTEEIEGSAPPAPASGRSSGGLLSAADRASFAALAAQLPGDEGVAVTTLGIDRPVSQAGSLQTGVAWSTGKAPVAMAAISAGVGSQADLTQAITASDNAAAERLFTALGDGERAAAAATAQVRAAGDLRTVIEGRRLRSGFTAFGQTNWPLADQARFVGGMACTDAGAQVLGLMNQVVAGQRWGLGSTGNQAQFKGGWGPGVTPGAGDGWLDRQMGVLTIKGRPIAVAIATTAADHGSGTQNLTTIARWVASHVGVDGAPRRPRC